MAQDYTQNILTSYALAVIHIQSCIQGNTKYVHNRNKTSINRQ